MTLRSHPQEKKNFPNSKRLKAKGFTGLRQLRTDLSLLTMKSVTFTTLATHWLKSVCQHRLRPNLNQNQKLSVKSNKFNQSPLVRRLKRNHTNRGSNA